MNSLLKKLNYKDQPHLLMLNIPESFRPNLKGLHPDTKLAESLESDLVFDFVLAFVTKQEEINQIVPKLNLILPGDGILWFAYPKASSKNYRCDFNRDSGWEMLGQLGFEPVRQVAIDEDWSALRFRRVEFIKQMNRRKDMAISQEGREKTQGKKS